MKNGLICFSPTCFPKVFHRVKWWWNKLFHPVKYFWNALLDDPPLINFNPFIFDFPRYHYYPRPPPFERARRDLSIGAGLVCQLLKTNHLLRRRTWLPKAKSVENISNRISPKSVKNVFDLCFTNLVLVKKLFGVFFHRVLQNVVMKSFFTEQFDVSNNGRHKSNHVKYLNIERKDVTSDQKPRKVQKRYIQSDHGKLEAKSCEFETSPSRIEPRGIKSISKRGIKSISNEIDSLFDLCPPPFRRAYELDRTLRSPSL